MEGGGEMRGKILSGAEVRPTRRALGVINHNFGGGDRYPCVVNKRGYPEY